MHRSASLDQTSGVFSRPSGTTTGRFVITKHELGYDPSSIFSVHQITVEMVGAGGRWGIQVSPPGNENLQAHTITPTAAANGSTTADTITISDILVDVIQVDMVGTTASQDCKVHIVSRARGFGN